MSDKLKQLEKQYAENKAVLEKARLARAKSSQDLDNLLKQIYILAVEDVPAFVEERNKLQDCGEIYNLIVSNRQAREDDLYREINNLKLKELVAANEHKVVRLEEIMQRLPFLPSNDPERADLQIEYDELRK